MRLIDADALIAYCNDNWIPLNVDAVNAQSTIQPELTDEQSITHLQSSGWMQRHDKEMYESGLKKRLADDSDSYDSLLPTVQLEPHWIPCSERLPKETGEYLVTKISIGWNYEDYTENDIAYWDNHKGFCKEEKVIAWMPIPKLTGGVMWSEAD